MILQKKKDINNWVKKNNFEILIHFAAKVPTDIVNKDYKRALKINYLGTKYLVDSIIKHNKSLKWLFFASTSHVYSLQKRKIKENFKKIPSSKYGKTKLLAENYIKKKLKNSHIKFCIGRIFSILDNKNRSFFTPSLIKNLKRKPKELILKNLNHYRDFLTTEEISKIIFFLWNKNYDGVINIGSGKETNLKIIAKKFALKAKKKIIFIENKSTFLIADITKLRKLGFKYKKINYSRFFS